MPRSEDLCGFHIRNGFFFEILCYEQPRNWFIWHSPRESRLYWSPKIVCISNIKKVCLNYMIWTMCTPYTLSNLCSKNIKKDLSGQWKFFRPRKLRFWFLQCPKLQTSLEICESKLDFCGKVAQKSKLSNFSPNFFANFYVQVHRVYNFQKIYTHYKKFRLFVKNITTRLNTFRLPNRELKVHT